MKKVVLFALIAALGAGILLYFYLGNLKKKQEVQIDYENIIIAAVDIPAYTTITADMLSIKQMPVGSAQPLAARSSDEVVGYVTENDIVKSEEIITSKLKQPGEASSGLSYIIPEGMRAVTIAIDEISGVAGFLQAGDYVDVISFTTTAYQVGDDDKTPEELIDEIANSGDASTQGTTVVAAQNVRIAAIGTSLSNAAAAEDGELGYSSVTLFLTPEQAMRVIHGAKSGVIQLVLRASNDHEANEEDPVVSDTLLEPAE